MRWNTTRQLPTPNESPRLVGDCLASLTNSSLQISIFQIHQIFNISYFPQFNPSFEKKDLFPKGYICISYVNAFFRPRARSTDNRFDVFLSTLSPGERTFGPGFQSDPNYIRWTSFLAKPKRVFSLHQLLVACAMGFYNWDFVLNITKRTSTQPIVSPGIRFLVHFRKPLVCYNSFFQYSKI